MYCFLRRAAIDGGVKPTARHRRDGKEHTTLNLGVPEPVEQDLAPVVAHR